MHRPAAFPSEERHRALLTIGGMRTQPGPPAGVNTFDDFTTYIIEQLITRERSFF